MAKIVLPLGGGPSGEPPYGGLGEEGWARGVTFYELVEREPEHATELEAAFHACRVPPDWAAALERYPRRVRVLALCDATDLASRLVVARAERLFTLSARIWMRVFDPGTSADLVQRYAPHPRALPLLVFFGEDQKEFARWSPSGETLEGAPAASPEGATPPLPALWRLLAAHAPEAP